MQFASLPTQGQLTQAFEAWENDFRANPEDFLTAVEVAAMKVAPLSEQRAIYFMALLRSQAEPAPAKPSVFHGVFHEAPYTARVLRPVRGSADRIGVLPIQVYAIGAGITVSGERSDLTGRQGTFELEANGKFFVFEVLCARKADWFVSVVERDVAAIWQQIKAVDEVKPPQGRDAFLHACSSQKTCIVTLPRGIGKTTIAPELATALGCHTIIDDWGPKLTVLPGALHLTSEEVPA